MAATNSAMRHVSATEPSSNDLYVPPERFRSGPEGALVWDVMRLCISKPGAIWCTICKTWYKYHNASMPGLVRHCTQFHSNNAANKGATHSMPPPPGPPRGPPLPPPAAPVAPVAPFSPKKSPSRVALPRPHTSTGPPLPPPVAPTSSRRAVGANSAPKPPLANTPPTKARSTKAATSTVPPAKTPPASKKSSAKTQAAPSSSKAAAPGAAAASSGAPPPPKMKLPVADGGVSKRRAPVTRVIAAPEAVRRVAERCQSLLFDSTGMTFFNVKFQVPRSKEEALSVIRSGIKDMEKSEDSRKLYFLGWAHSQIFSAEMAALGYRFITAGIRCDTTMTKPPALESWLTLELPLRGNSRRKLRPVHVPQPSSSLPPGPSGTPQLPAPKAPKPVVAEAVAKRTSPKKEKGSAPGAQTAKGSPGPTARSPTSQRKSAGRIIDTIDLT